MGSLYFSVLAVEDDRQNVTEDPVPAPNTRPSPNWGNDQDNATLGRIFFPEMVRRVARSVDISIGMVPTRAT